MPGRHISDCPKGLYDPEKDSRVASAKEGFNRATGYRIMGVCFFRVAFLFPDGPNCHRLSWACSLSVPLLKG